MPTLHNLGFPRIGELRELKQALEKYWRTEISADQLQQTSITLTERHWQWQATAGIQYIPVGDFSLYDHVLDTAAMLGVSPERFRQVQDPLQRYFYMARGRANHYPDTQACRMLKWFDTNYHYLVPELKPHEEFHLCNGPLSAAIDHARLVLQGFDHAKPKPVILGPLSFLWVSRCAGETFDKLSLLPALIPVYQQLLASFNPKQTPWLQIDEPILCLDLPYAWQRAFESTYSQLSCDAKLMLTTYFGDLQDQLYLACRLPVAGLHLDLVRAPRQLQPALNLLGREKILSAGVIDGRNIWIADLEKRQNDLQAVADNRGDNLWLAPSCSLLHCPINLEQETGIDAEIKPWLAFAKQKLDELYHLQQWLNGNRHRVEPALQKNAAAWQSRRQSAKLHQPNVRARTEALNEEDFHRRLGYAQRSPIQRQALDLPLLPTTTIGSFPQTPAIRQARRQYKNAQIPVQEYDKQMQSAIAQAIYEQENAGLDVLVHGEAERNDMVEYFAEHLSGFCFTEQGWVQSYGSRCVKPPILYGDSWRPLPITLNWWRYAQSLTNKPVKAMLTGPVTIAQWSFIREDQSREQTCLQIALALRDEVLELEKAGARIIQVDEPAFREGLPLRTAPQQSYLQWEARCFRLVSGSVKSQTQVHTHMCYSDFNTILPAIAELDADVISIESARSDLSLLSAFADYHYPNAIGPGCYDIHSPRTPAIEDIKQVIDTAMQYLPAERLWINPDCGLKTRTWPEASLALHQMVKAARMVREQVGQANEWHG